jgi:anti-anti-sigma factor
MPVSAENRYGKCVARVVGEMDVYAVSTLRARFVELLSGTEEVELNLAEVTDFDSAGLQLLLWFGREAARAKVKCRVTGASAAVGELTGLYNLKQAIAGIAGS